jgi:ribonucleoside-diphosphate reductase subunit M2
VPQQGQGPLRNARARRALLAVLATFPAAMQMHPDDANEPMLQENASRFVIFPIKHHDLWLMFKKSQASFWTAEEIDLANDMNDWEGLKPDEQFFIKHG